MVYNYKNGDTVYYFHDSIFIYKLLYKYAKETRVKNYLYNIIKIMRGENPESYGDYSEAIENGTIDQDVNNYNFINIEDINDLKYITSVADYINKLLETQDLNLNNIVGVYGKKVSDSVLILQDYLPMSWSQLNSFTVLNTHPEAADGIYIYNDNTLQKCIGFIQFGTFKRKFNSPLLYTVGLTSDIHYDDNALDDNISNHIYSWDSFYADSNNFLDFFNNYKDKVDFICSSGDVGSNDILHDKNFKLLLNNYNIPFYSCYGNHDYDAAYGNLASIQDMSATQFWNECMIGKLSGTQGEYSYEEKVHYNSDSDDITIADKEYANYYTVYNIGNGKQDIYIYLSVDFGIDQNHIEWQGQEHFGNDHSTELAQKMLDYDDPAVITMYKYVYGDDWTVEQLTDNQKQYDYQFYNSDVLLWFKDQLEYYRNNRIFIFTHLFFPHKAGTNNMDINYYNYADDYWRISQKDDYHGAYCLCGIQFDFLNKLNNEYKNTIWFTGHSHYVWDWQQNDSGINITNVEYDYYHPKDEDFIKKQRYMRKYPLNYPFKLWQKYYNTNVDKKINKNTSSENYYEGPTLSLQLPIDELKLHPGEYKIQIIARAAVTTHVVNNFSWSDTGNYYPWANGHTEYQSGDEYQYVCMIQSNSLNDITPTSSIQKNQYQPVILEKTNTYNKNHDYDCKDPLYEFTLTVDSDTPNTFIQLWIRNVNTNKAYNAGANWYVLGIYDIINITENNKSYIELFENINVMNRSISSNAWKTADKISTEVIPDKQFENIDIIKTNTGYNVHLPSAGRPIPTGCTSYYTNAAISEFAVMDVYENYVEIKGVVAERGQNNIYINKYLPLSQYRINIPAG